MAQESVQLKFNCYLCGSVNFYPVKRSKNDKGGKIILKRCTNCSAENRIELSAGWVAGKLDEVHRGLKSD